MSVASRSKGRTTWADEFELEQTVRAQSKADLRMASPWQTSETSWRALSAPLLWVEQMAKDKADAAAAAAADEDQSNEEAEDAFSKHRKILGDAIKSAKNVNKFYIPISQLPPLGGKNPADTLGVRPPSCAPHLSVSRASRIMERWQSMPKLRSQLPPDSLKTIEAFAKQYSDAHRAGAARPTSKIGGSPGRRTRSPLGRRPSLESEVQMPLRREDTNHRLVRAFVEAEEGSARGRKEKPHIACTCCDRETPRPWMSGEGGSSARIMSGPPSASNTGRATGRASGRAASSSSATRAGAGMSRSASDSRVADGGHSRVSSSKPSISFAT